VDLIGVFVCDSAADLKKIIESALLNKIDSNSGCDKIFEISVK